MHMVIASIKKSKGAVEDALLEDTDPGRVDVAGWRRETVPFGQWGGVWSSN